ncbi:calU3 [Lysobacter antibioticus]|nr:STM4014 family protein [Lysobacter antibioticus]ALN63630.1 calU3 [Lysobacter antibioticus]
MSAAPWLLFGPHDSRRVRGLQQALRERGLPAAEVVDYQSLLSAPERAAEAIAGRRGAMVKLESPGEAPALHAALIERGWHRLGAPCPAPQPLEHGELAYQQYWYAGFADLLRSLPAEAAYLNPPDDIACMSDKLACQQRLIAAGIEVPPLLGPVEGYEALRERLRDCACDQVFVKARYGSSGAGVLAYRRNRVGREIAYGSAELVESDGRARVFNSLRPRRYTATGEIARLVDTLAAQGAYLERWIPKPRAPDALGGHYDLRVVALDGQARQRVARVSRRPLTNLHLGNRRGALEAWLDTDSMQALEAATKRAASVFPRSRMIGFDLILRDRRSWLLEANAFGDLLPNLLWQGRGTYDDQAALTPSPQATTGPQRSLAHA